MTASKITVMHLMVERESESMVRDPSSRDSDDGNDRDDSDDRDESNDSDADAPTGREREKLWREIQVVETPEAGCGEMA